MHIRNGHSIRNGQWKQKNSKNILNFAKTFEHSLEVVFAFVGKQLKVHYAALGEKFETQRTGKNKYSIFSEDNKQTVKR